MLLRFNKPSPHGTVTETLKVGCPLPTDLLPTTNDEATMHRSASRGFILTRFGDYQYSANHDKFRQKFRLEVVSIGKYSTFLRAVCEDAEDSTLQYEFIIGNALRPNLWIGKYVASGIFYFYKDFEVAFGVKIKEYLYENQLFTYVEADKSTLTVHCVRQTFVSRGLAHAFRTDLKRQARHYVGLTEEVFLHDFYAAAPNSAALRPKSLVYSQTIENYQYPQLPRSAVAAE